MPAQFTVAIIPGFAEGRYLTKRLNRALTASGYDVIDDQVNADILIAHSGGCYFIPEHARAKTVLHIGYPYWPGRRLRSAARLKIIDEYHKMPFLRWLRKCAINAFYIIRISHTRRMSRGYANREHMLRKLPAGQIFVKNHYDPLCNLDAIREVAGQDHTYITLPGYHDHLWDNPEQYVNLLKSVV